MDDILVMVDNVCYVGFLEKEEEDLGQVQGTSELWGKPSDSAGQKKIDITDYQRNIGPDTITMTVQVCVCIKRIKFNPMKEIKLSINARQVSSICIKCPHIVEMLKQ
ncbi:uncharacterized protein LOC124265765 [Haliotis rubra]|uniref:uncharacterized protein LOC124265765 n=1 Tax=Haliotis rubra TaxID=36100 RepID=UPI001EE5C387|nr:uncharacterized protein LOC124265765 [Haliotis rubra]